MMRGWRKTLLGAVLLTGIGQEIPKPVDAPQPLSPEATAASYNLPPGFRLEVVASEPWLASPSGVCWDARGRMFVSELHGYNLEGELDIQELNKSGKLDTKVRRVQAEEKFKQAAEPGTYGVIKLLRDLNGDGRADDAITWATNIPPAYGLVATREGVIVACAPHIIYLADKDGDDRAETKEILFTGFRTGALERGINCPQWGADGWIYFGRGWGGSTVTGPHLKEPVRLTDSDFRIKADGSAIEPVTGGTHTFGFATTLAGDRFVVTTTVPGIYVAPLSWRELRRNPNAMTPGLEAPTGDRRAYSISKPHPWRQKRADDPAYFDFYKSRYGAAESEADGWFTAACGPMIYQDEVLPGLQGQYFVCEPSGNLIHRALIRERNGVLELERAAGEEKSEFAASSDTWSHPIRLVTGPDGFIYIVDYYREIIEDYSAIPRHLQQQYGLYRGHDRGRIYRLVHERSERAKGRSMASLGVEELARELGNPRSWRRQTAQRLLVEGAKREAAPAIRKRLAPDASAGTIIAALRTLEGLNELRAGDLLPWFQHADPAVRVHALQLIERFSRESGMIEALAAGVSRERDARVLIQYALSFGNVGDARSFRELVRLAREHHSIRWMDAAILSSVYRREMDLLAELLRPPEADPELLERLAQTVVADDAEHLSLGLRLLGHASPGAQVAVLRGFAKGARGRAGESNGHRPLVMQLAASGGPEVRKSAEGLLEALRPKAEPDEPDAKSTAEAEVELKPEILERFVSALKMPRDLERGRELFSTACASCHRMGEAGHEVGPDLFGQLGLPEESLLQELLAPSARIRPGFEMTEIRLNDGTVHAGILKVDGATSLTLRQANGVEQTVLRREVERVSRLANSFMPAFTETLSPRDAADLLGWLKRQAQPPP